MTRLDNIHSAVRSSVQFYKDRPNPGQPTPFSMDEFVHRIRHAVHISTVAVGYIALQIQVKVVNLGYAWLGTGHETHKVFSSVLSKSKTTHKLTDTLVLSLTINLIVQKIPSWQCFIMVAVSHTDSKYGQDRYKFNSFGFTHYWLLSHYYYYYILGRRMTPPFICL